MEAKDTFTDYVISGLRKAANDIEKFRLQAALGKAEAKDLYEKSKKDFSKQLKTAKDKAEKMKMFVGENALAIKKLLEELQLQLALGKAETKEAFEIQRKKIITLLGKIEKLIKNNPKANEYYAGLQMEIEKFKIKLEITKLNYKLKRLDAKKNFNSEKKEFSAKVNELKSKMFKKEASFNKKWEHFNSEISTAYKHLKKAFANN